MAKRKLPPHNMFDRPVRMQKKQLGWFRRLYNKLFGGASGEYRTTQVEAVHEPEHCLRCMYEKRLHLRRSR